MLKYAKFDKYPKNIYFPKVNTKEINSGFFRINQGFGREKDENRSKFKGYILVIICCKVFEKFVLCRYISQPKTVVIVYSKPIASRYIWGEWPSGLRR